jgi:hypothetical protein
MGERDEPTRPGPDVIGANLGESPGFVSVQSTPAGDVFCLGGDYRGAGPTDEGRAAYADALLERTGLTPDFAEFGHVHKSVWL